MDDNELFRAITLRICGNLEIAEALYAAWLYLRREIPADAAILECFDPGLRAMRSLARVDATGAHRLQQTTSLPKPILGQLAYRDRSEVGQTTPINRPSGNPVAAALLRTHGFDHRSVSILPMQLLSTEGVLGGIVLVAEGSDRFTGEHARRLSLLAEPFAIALQNALAHEEVQRLRDRLADDNRYLRRELLGLSEGGIVGADFGLRDVMQQVRQVAPTDSPVLLLGETGVGKDVVARAIHLASRRRDGPFVAVNCGAIPQTLV
ncbi:MAG: sigma 54-interacting transcriptional regulator, partial [Holophagales bacterium]|nr:sigma 54-interacting transcriptional regulator [Holophagales bacterium]